MSNVRNNAAAQETRRKLIHAAGEVFAEQGFDRATIRDITDRAAVNIAAVNYHFKDKAELYAAAVRHAHCASLLAAPISPSAGKPEDRLHAFVREFLTRLLDPSRPHWHSKLLSRELVEPTAALDLLVNENIAPGCAQLHSIIQDLTAGKLSHDQAMLAGFSIVGQCVFYMHARHVVARLHPPMATGPLDVAALAAHISEFSLGALARLAAQRKRRPTRQKRRSR